MARQRLRVLNARFAMVTVNTSAVPSSLRRANERTILGLLLRREAASRAELAKAAGMSQPTVGKIIGELLKLGVVHEVEATNRAGRSAEGTAARVGRPGRMVRLDGERPRFLAMHLGVAETRLAALPVAVRAPDCWTHTFPTTGTAQTWLRNLRRVAAKLPAEGLWGTLIGVPGIVDERRGAVRFSPNLHWTERVNLPELVREIWPKPVLLVQEIRALALGHLAVEGGSEDFLLVDFGQGVGGAIIEQGKLFSSPLPLNGEFGHAPVPGNGRRCGCGASGCLETLVSRPGLLESHAAATAPQPATWAGLTQHLVLHGLPSWLRATLDSTAAIVAGALNVLGLREVVITGSLTELPPTVVEYLSARIKEGALWARFGELKCHAAARRRAAGLVAMGIDRLLVPPIGRARLLHRHEERLKEEA